MGMMLQHLSMALPQDVLARLASLSGYEQMLEMDSVSRNTGMGLAEIESQVAAYKASASQPSGVNPQADFQPVASKELVDLSASQPMNQAPKYIDNPDQYRMKYDPPSRVNQTNLRLIKQ